MHNPNQATTQTPHEAECLENAAYFTVVRGRTPKSRTKVEAPTMDAARDLAKEHGDGRSMIYAVHVDGRSAHIENA